MKKRLVNEGSELYDKIVRLKLKAKDGKLRETDVLDTKGIFRLIESVPSPNAEPLKLWLADLGEIATRELTEEYKPYGLEQTKKMAQIGGDVAKVTRNDLENKLGKTVISKDNSLPYKYVNNKKIENNIK